MTEAELWAASEAGDEARVGELIQAGADVHSKNPGGNNGLILSSQEGHDKIVKMFLESGVGVNTRSFYERTPLMLAVKEGHYTTAKLLLDNKADPDLQREDGITARMDAAMQNHAESIYPGGVSRKS